MTEEERKGLEREIGPAASGIGRAGKAPVLTLVYDSNGDGTPDSGFVLGLVGGIMGILGGVLSGGSPIGQLAHQFLAKLPQLKAFTGGGP